MLTEHTNFFNIKTEIFDIPQIKLNTEDVTAPENLVVQLKVSYCDCKNEWLRHLIGDLSDEFINAIRNIKYTYKCENHTDRFGEDYLYETISFVYPEMPRECKVLIEKLFFKTEYPSWVDSKVYADEIRDGHRVFVGYTTGRTILISDKDCGFLGNMLCYKQTGWFSGDVKYRAYLK